MSGKEIVQNIKFSILFLTKKQVHVSNLKGIKIQTSICV